MANTKSLDFESSTPDYLYYDNAESSLLALTGDFTIMAWVKLESMPGEGERFVIVSKEDSNTNSEREYQFHIRTISGDQFLQVEISNGSSLLSVGYDAGAVFSDLQDNGWHHVCVTYTSSNQTAKFYLDGTLKYTSPGGSAYAAQDGDAVFRVGTEYDSGTNYEFDGLMDELNIFDAALPIGLINYFMTFETTGIETNLIAAWGFDDTLEDKTSNNLDLTHSGTPSYVADVPFVNNSTTTGEPTTTTTVPTTTTTAGPSTTTTPPPTTTTTPEPTTTSAPLGTPGALAFGEENPMNGETAVSWQTFDDGAGGIPTIEGDGDWGKLRLEIGEEGNSRVYNLGPGFKAISLTRNVYGTGNGTSTLQIRGSNSYFTRNAGTPSWENYTAPTNKNWKFLQVRENKTS